MDIDFPFGERLLLGADGVAHSITGTLTTTELDKITIPAGFIKAGDILDIWSFWTVPNNANNKTCQARLGGAAGDMFLNVNLTTNLHLAVLTRIMFPTLTTQLGMNASNQNGLGTSASEWTGTRNMAVAQDLCFYGTLGNVGDTMAVSGYTVELLRQKT